ncbi:MAG: hypothetical protein ACI9DF_005727 [Verrucomicrobiales bacterium]|jgi:hypothetical protein
MTAKLYALLSLIALMQSLAGSAVWVDIDFKGSAVGDWPSFGGLGPATLGFDPVRQAREIKAFLPRDQVSGIEALAFRVGKHSEIAL